MKRSLLVLIAALFFIQSAYAFTIPFTNIKILEPESPKINEAAVVIPEEKALLVEFKEVKTDDLWTQVKDIVINPSGKKTIQVLYKDKFLAELPAGSRFEGVPVHATCLEFQYGTEDWYNCEMVRR